jgi:glucokinase
MAPGQPRLLGDVGGTNARWAWQAAPGAAIEAVQVHSTDDHPTLADSALAYLHAIGRPPVAAAAIGVATAITGDEVRLTNHHWSFSIAALRARLGVRQCLVLNDFTALAMSLPALAGADLRVLRPGTPVEGTPRALIGPGTGLGVSGLVGAAGHEAALAGEGGHVTLAAADDTEAALLAWLRSRHGHVSAERVLSGPGLVNLYEAVCAVNGVAAQALTPAEVADRGAQPGDAACAAALAHFAAFLGNVAGNLALTLGARGGVYVGGGIVPRLGAAFDGARFAERFLGKGRFADYLDPVPCWLIVAGQPALAGAARALDAAARA